MSHDIVDNFRSAAWGPEGLVIAVGVEDEFAQKRPVLTDHPDVLVGHQEADGHTGVGPPEADVAKSAEVAEGDPALVVHPVVADAVVDGGICSLGPGLEAGVEGSEWSSAGQGSVGPVLVVIGTESVELELQDRQGRCWGLLGQETLQGLVKTLNFAAGLGVVGGGVLEDDSQAFQLGLEQDLATAGLAAKDGTVVGQEGRGVALAGASEVETLNHISTPSQC